MSTFLQFGIVICLRDGTVKKFRTTRYSYPSDQPRTSLPSAFMYRASAVVRFGDGDEIYIIKDRFNEYGWRVLENKGQELFEETMQWPFRELPPARSDQDDIEKFLLSIPAVELTEEQRILQRGW